MARSSFELGNQFLSPGLRTVPEKPYESAEILSWRPHRNEAGTQLGYLDVRLPSRMIVRNAKLMVGQAGKFWIAGPAIRTFDKEGKPVIQRDGKQRWTVFVDFAADDRDIILAALRRQHPEVFEEGER